jgi:ribonuclease D
MLPAELQRTISPEEVNALPIRRYEGGVRLVDSQPALEQASAEIRSDCAAEGVLGFDTETRPAFRPGERHLPCLVQIATARAVYLFRLQHADCGAALAALLANARLVKAGVGLADDLRELRRVFAFEANAALDLGNLAKRHGLKQSGVRNLAGLFLGCRIPKGSKTSNWAAPQLSPQQIAYAATDAWICRELYFRFRELGLVPGPAKAR